ncbi:MAG: hypothetical protein U0Z44_08285 [Kouleothrix sp.]
MLLLLLILGIYPAPIMDLANQTATALVNVFTRCRSSVKGCASAHPYI